MREVLLTLGLGLVIGIALILGRREKKPVKRIAWTPQRVDQAMN